MTWLNCCEPFWWLYFVDSKDSICLISFFELLELFTAFICANNIESLVNDLFGVKIFNPGPSLNSSSSLSSGMAIGVSQ